MPTPASSPLASPAPQVVAGPSSITQDHVDSPPRVSVIIPTFQGERWIVDCLDSLAAQTVPWTDFEAVVVQNGPPTRTRELVEGWLARHPGFRLEFLEAEVAGASHARNIGLDRARGDYVTFLDDDDRIGPRLLETLLAKARPDVITVAAVGFVVDNDFTRPDFGNWYTVDLLPYVGRPATNYDLYVALTLVCAKLVSTDLARRVRFREDLRIAEDRVFWMGVLAAERVRLELVPLSPEAAYYYHIRQDSVLRRGDGLSWEGAIQPWLDVAAAHLAIAVADEQNERIRQRALHYVFGHFIRSYLREHPDDVRRVHEALRERGMRHSIPWFAAHYDLARNLTVLGTRPDTDAAGIPLAQRLLDHDAITDVITYVASDADTTVEQLLAPAAEVVDQTLRFSGPERLTWDLFGKVVERLLVELESKEQDKPGPYQQLLSRSAAPVEHCLAAFVKLSRPAVRWTVEFASAPAGATVPGAGVIVTDDRHLQILGAGLVEAGFAIEEVPETLAELTELVALGLADAVVFETEDQRDAILARCPVPEVGERARARSHVGAAPELEPAGWPFAAVVPSPSPETAAVIDPAAGAAPEGPLVSVIVPTHQGDRWIRACLDALAAQTLKHSDFEVVVVQNGPLTRTRRIVARFTAAHPKLQVKYVEADEVGAAHARNRGLDEAAGAYVTFVDDDDRVGPRYLEQLVAKAGPGRIPVAPIGMVVGGDFHHPRFDNWLTSPLVPFLGTQASNADLAVAAHAAVAKLVPLELARRVRFDETLELGEDTAFWVAVLAASSSRLTLTDFAEDAAYLYQARAGSATARVREFSWEFHIERHLDAIAAIDAVETDDADVAAVRAYVIANLFRTVRGYTRARPRDLARVDEAIRHRALRDVPWQLVHEGAAHELALIGTDAIAAGRLGARGVICDVIAFPSPDDDVAAALEAAEPVIDQLVTIGLPALSWTIVDEVLTRGLRAVGSLSRDKDLVHSTVTSCSAGPVEHLVAALVKRSRPAMRWRAEFVGDHTAAAADRSAAVAGGGTLDVLLGGLETLGLDGGTAPSLMGELAEVIALAAADDVVFASADERDRAIARCPEAARERAGSVARLAGPVPDHGLMAGAR